MGSFNTHSINGFQGFLAAVIGHLVRFAPYAKSPLARCLGFFTFFLADATVKARYAAIGALDTAMIDAGEHDADRAVGVEHAFWKRTYADRGFRAVRTEAFAAAVAQGDEPDGLGVRTEERPTLRSLPAVNAELLARLKGGEFSMETPKIDAMPAERCEPNVQIIDAAPAVVVRPSVPVGRDPGPVLASSRKGTSGTHLGLAPIVLNEEQLAALHARSSNGSREQVEPIGA